MAGVIGAGFRAPWSECQVLPRAAIQIVHSALILTVALGSGTDFDVL